MLFKIYIVTYFNYELSQNKIPYLDIKQGIFYMTPQVVKTFVILNQQIKKIKI